LEQDGLSPEAKDTLFISGLPLDITKREVAHILRPFDGFQVQKTALFQLLKERIQQLLVSFTADRACSCVSYPISFIA
jgi:hypothetical protein